MIGLAAELLLLLVVANGAPVLVARLAGGRLSRPIDGGCRLGDGQPLLGASKTWRGLVGSVLATALVAWLLRLGWLFGACFGLMAMLGDLLSSFCKRRLRLNASTRATGIDQIPESALPLWTGMAFLDYGYGMVVLGTLAFFLLEALGSPLLYRLGIRNRPY